MIDESILVSILLMHLLGLMLNSVLVLIHREAFKSKTYLSIDQVSNVAVLNVALLVTDSFRLGFERPWNRYHPAMANLRNPNCSGQEHKEMGKTVRLDTGLRQSHGAMGDNNISYRPGPACPR